MKKILFFLLLINAIGCQTSTEDKIKSKVLELEKSALEKDGHKIEDIKIDKVVYSLISQEFCFQEYESTISLLHSEQDLLDTKLLVTLDMIKDSAQIAKIHEDKTERAKENELIQKRLVSADTIRNIYKVVYEIQYKTDKKSYSGKSKEYLNMSDLSEADLKIIP